MFDSMCRPKRLDFDAAAAIYGKSMQGLLTASGSRRKRLLTLGSAVLGGAMLVVPTCSDESSGNDGDPHGLALFVFPHEVEPLGQATVAVEVCDRRRVRPIAGRRASGVHHQVWVVEKGTQT